MFHVAVKIIGRSSGRSAIASSAYRSGEKLYDEETGLTHDYTRKIGVVHSEILLPPNAPKEFFNRQNLWNSVQKIEKNKNAQLAREIEVGLPRETTKQQQEEIVKEYVINNFVQYGMCADYAIHDKNDGNPHAHIMVTTRSLTENREWAPKSKKVYDLDTNGERIFQKIDGSGRKIYKNHKEDYNDWNQKGKVEEWRADWSRVCNQYLDKEHQIDHRSYVRQGIEKIPTIHEGYSARAIAKKGGFSERVEINRQIKIENGKLEFIKEKIVEMKETKEKIIKAISKPVETIKEHMQRLKDDRGQKEPIREHTVTEIPEEQKKAIKEQIRKPEPQPEFKKKTFEELMNELRNDKRWTEKRPDNQKNNNDKNLKPKERMEQQLNNAQKTRQPSKKRSRDDYDIER